MQRFTLRAPGGRYFTTTTEAGEAAVRAKYPRCEVVDVCAAKWQHRGRMPRGRSRTAAHRERLHIH